MKKILLSVLIMVGTAAAFAQVPGTLSYQGILVKTSPPADAGKPVDDGLHFVRFLFYNVPVGGSPVYSSLGTGSGNSVTTYKGMFSFVIGSGSPGNDPIPAGIFNEQLYVEVVADGVTLTPRIPLTTTPYTFRAQTVNAVDATAINTGTIADARLSTHLQDLADGTLTGSKVGTGINAANITTGTLGVANGGTGATTAAAARTNLGLGSLSTLNAVGSTEITDGSVATTDLADNSVTTAKIVDGTIANADINASAAIAVTKLAAGTNGQLLTTTGGVPTWTTPAFGTVTSVATGTGLTGGPITTTGTVSIATGGVTTALLADNSVTSAKIVDATIATADLADGSVSTVKLADNSVTSAKIVDGTIATADIADGAITAAKLASGSTLTGSGATNRLAFWSGTTALSSSSTLTWNGTNLGIGPASATNFLHVAADVGGSTSVATLEGHSATASRGPGITFLRSKGSLATPSAVADGDYLGGVGALGRTASAYNISSGIQFEVDGAVAGTSVPGRITFSTTNVASSSASEKMRLTNDGRLGIGTTTPSFPLDVNFSVGASTAKFGASNPICFVANAPMVGFNIFWGTGYTYHSSNFGGILTFNQELSGGFSFNTAPSGTAGTAATMTSRLAISNTGNVGIGTTTPSSALEVNGYTKLGSSAPGIRTALFTGTTGSTQGATVSIPLTGITGAQILSVDVMVEWAAGSWLSQGYYNTGYKFYWYTSGSTIFVINDATSSGFILSRPIRVFVIYQP
jgi:hypothetical protein